MLYQPVEGVIPCYYSALKTRRCSGLDSWIVPAWSLKNKEVFRVGLVDGLVDRPRMEPKKKKVFRI